MFTFNHRENCFVKRMTLLSFCFHLAFILDISFSIEWQQSTANMNSMNVDDSKEDQREKPTPSL